MPRTKYEITNQSQWTFSIVFVAQGWENISIIFTKYVSKNQQGIEIIQPKNWDTTPKIDDKNPKIIKPETIGKIKRLVMRDTKDILPKLYTIMGKVKIWAAKVVEIMPNKFSILYFPKILNKSLKNGSKYIIPIEAKKDNWKPIS